MTDTTNTQSSPYNHDDEKGIGFKDEPSLTDQIEEDEQDSASPEFDGAAAIKLLRRAQIASYVLLWAMPIPWVYIMIISWMRLTELGLDEAPHEIFLSAIASTLEVVIIIIATCVGGSFDSKSPNLKRRLITFMGFILVDPPVTGVYMMYRSYRLPCKFNSDTLHCRSLARVIHAIGSYRLFVILILFILTLHYYRRLDVDLQELQKRVDNTPNLDAANRNGEQVPPMEIGAEVKTGNPIYQNSTLGFMFRLAYLLLFFLLLLGFQVLAIYFLVRVVPNFDFFRLSVE
ncbi:hypothetical protein B0O99DRAFT_598252 [Bisporella sp. PMI_857]|nr:hypothetical protein B0O99DRAFT_598252 [Bisporella sp. PMI_857]